jgi:hypothetical protein
MKKRQNHGNFDSLFVVVHEPFVDFYYVFGVQNLICDSLAVKNADFCFKPRQSGRKRELILPKFIRNFRTPFVKSPDIDNGKIRIIRSVRYHQFYIKSLKKSCPQFRRIK